jgi:hypothetical protein
MGVVEPGMNANPEQAPALFEESLNWLREHYGQFEFWVERDLVWTVQTRLRTLIRERSLPYEVFNDYPLLPETRRADLVIRNADKEVLVAAEFKYEPSHQRAEFVALPGKLPVVFWDATSATGPRIPGRPGGTGMPAGLAVHHRRSCGQAGRMLLTRRQNSHEEDKT